MREKTRVVLLSADEFMTRHATELEESDEILNARLLASIFPEREMPLSFLITPSPRRDAWLEAQEKLPGKRLRRELKEYWLFRLLKAAREENSPEAYRDLLEGWLIQLGVEAPEGVFLPPRRSRGAPRKESTAQIYRIWLTNGRPAWHSLAFLVYHADYTRAGGAQRKKLRDRCARAVRRHETRLGDENHPN